MECGSIMQEQVPEQSEVEKLAMPTGSNNRGGIGVIGR